MAEITEDPYFYDRLAHTLKKAIDSGVEAAQFLNDDNPQAAGISLARAIGLIEGAHDQVKRVKIIPGEGPDYEQEEGLGERLKKGVKNLIP